MLKNISKILLSTTLALGSLGLHANEVTLKAVSAFDLDTHMSHRFKSFVDKVNEEGKGLVQIQIVGGPESIPAFEVGNAVRSGVVDLANSTGSFHANLVPEGLAMFITDRSIQELRENGGHALMDKIHQDKANMRWFARVRDGMQFHIYSNKPIDSTNLKGFKLRSAPVYLAFFRSLGATPLQTSPGETYTALERGVVDGYGWPSAGLFDLGWQEQTKYRVDPGFYNVEVSIFFNKDSWNKLNDEQRAFLQKQAEWIESTNKDDLVLTEDEKRKQKEAGIETIALPKDVADELLNKAYTSGWESIYKVSPDNAPELERLFGKGQS